MTLPPGTRLGPYNILSALGAGGMGEVYRAHDAKLNRDVAIKVLLPAVANDPDRLARFSREAQVLASLNHPNIAHIHGLEESGGVTALVLELVEGEDLAQRIAHGPIPLDEALPIARQIAEALEAAHDHGIIHRDLKPANIKVRADGTVKVLDFGLAKAIDSGSGNRTPGSVDAMNSPTLSIHATEAGLILGTAAYMSPEQAAGKPVDKRSDLWSFGVVLFEMLTGRQVFAGETVSHVLAAVLKDGPDWTALPPATPVSIHRLLRRCIEKDRTRRMADAADARLEIDEALSPSNLTNPSHRRLGSWPVFASFVIGGLVIGAAVWATSQNAMTPAPVEVLRFAIHDTDQVIVSRVEGSIALSPDGRTLAFVGLGDGGPRIWIHELASLGSRPLAGTEGAAALGWSPDGRFLAFGANGRIKRIAIAGGASEVLNLTSVISGASGAGTLFWGADGTILLVDGRGYWRAPADGTTPAVLVRSADEFRDVTDFLPDGRHILFSVRSSDPEKAGTFVSAIDGSQRSRILPFPSRAQYAVGRILFVRDRILYAQAFDVPSLQVSGTPLRLAESAAVVFSASKTGAVAYLPLDGSERPDSTQLSWMDRAGRVLGRIDPAAGATEPVLSPNDQRLALILRNDLWILELRRDVLSRISSGGATRAPTWLPGNERIMFFRAAFRNGRDVVLETLAGSAGKEAIVFEPKDGHGDHAHPTDISTDGRYLVYEGGDGFDVWVLPLSGDKVPRAFVEGPDIQTQAMFSPDGRWLAYTSNASGRFEVYVEQFPQGSARIQVSPAGGGSARWRPDGKEIFYLDPDGTLMAVPVTSAAPIEFGKPTPLFNFFSFQLGMPRQRAPYDMTADGQRFIVSSVPRRNDPSIQLLINWPALMAVKTTP